MNIVLIETSGNQRYIFATNKLRENVGASELTYRVGTQFVLEAVGRSYDYKADLSGNELRKVLLNETRIEDSADADAVEIIVATSGKAILLTKNKERAEEIIRKVTQQALTNMPGLTVHGSIGDVEPDLTDIHKAIGEVHRRLETVRYQMPSNEQRFLRLPFVAPCETSGLPASIADSLSKEEKEKNEAHRFSQAAWTKRAVLRKRDSKYEKDDNYKPSRIVSLIKHLFHINLYENLELLENDFKDLSWIAVIHADGNGLGEIFLNFDEHSGLKDNKCKPRDYLENYRRFSLALDVCTVNAAGYALTEFNNCFLAEEETKNTQKDKLPVVPLILGGDDLTVLCEGQYALKFVYDFLRQFEAETENITPYDYLKDKIGDQTILEILNGTICKIAQNAFNVPHLGICAGVAIVKPHYPFHQAYELAEQLLRSAKQVKEKIKHQRKNERGEGKEIQLPSSALDFHILYDSAHSELTEIRDRKLKVEDKTYLSAKPCVVTESLDGQEQNLWLKYHRFEELRKRVTAMSAPDEDDITRRALPNSKLHEIRQSLFRGKDTARAEASLIQKRLDSKEAKKQFEELIAEDSIFFSEGNKIFTHFLDAIEAVDFWKGFDGEGTKPAGESNQKAEPSAANEVTK